MTYKLIRSILFSMLISFTISSVSSVNPPHNLSASNHNPSSMDDRILGLAISDNSQVSYEQAYDNAKEMGSDFTEFSIHWDDIEKSQNQYSLEWFEIINLFYRDKDIKIGLSIGAVDMVSDRRPQYLKNISFDNPLVTRKYNEMTIIDISTSLSKMKVTSGNCF